MLIDPKQSFPFHEDEMSNEVIRFLEGRAFRQSDGPFDKWVTPTILKEVTIPDLGRRSDIVVYFSDRKIYNIECKLSLGDEVFKQAKDHLKWADYSLVCMPHDAYLHNGLKSQMIEENIGLLLFYYKEHYKLEKDYCGVVEAIHCRKNTYNDKKKKHVRQKALKAIKIKKQRASDGGQTKIPE